MSVPVARSVRALFFASLFVLWTHTLTAQEPFLTVEHIQVSGHQKTRTSIILRELTFSRGDSLFQKDWESVRTFNEYRIMNTGLFLEAHITIDSFENRPDTIHIHLQENWYIYPIPVLEFADRNFNVWWKEQNRDWDRINYGIDFFYYNFSGRRDVLRLLVQNGYTQQLGLEYRQPFLNKAQTIGLELHAQFSRNREVNYATQNSEQQFFRSEDRFLLREWQAGADWIWRPGLFIRHRLGTSFQSIHTAPEIGEELNPDYLLPQEGRQRFFRLRYAFELDIRDQIPYAIEGYILQLAAVKEGLGFFGERDASWLRMDAAYFHLLSPRWSLAMDVSGRVQLQRTRPSFYHYQALGYGQDYIRGYEYYVMDGMDFLLLKSGLRFQLFNNELNLGKLMPYEDFRRMPLRAYLSFNLDGGAANDPFYATGNPLSNRWLWGGGIGLDLVFYYNRLIQIEYSINELGEKAVFLHYQLDL